MMLDKEAHAPDVSVVVPTYRRPDMLSRCLEGLLAQDFPANRYEIVVCDDGPDDHTRKCFELFSSRGQKHGLMMRYLPITATQGPAGARNAGWRAARGKVIAFTDDDTIPAPVWLSQGYSAFAPGIWAVTGTVEVPLDPPTYRDRPSDYELDASGLSSAEFVTANCLVLREALLRLEGFDERYTSAWREDSDLQFRILEAGGKIVKAGAARIVHPVRPARWGVSLSQQKKSQFDALLYKEHKDFYRQRVRAQPPWNYYAIVTCFLLAWGLSIAALVTATPASRTALLAISALAILAWLALTARFAIARLASTSRAPAHVAEMLWTSLLIPFLSVYWRLHGAFKFKVAFF